jgi:hypothetical protein
LFICNSLVYRGLTSSLRSEKMFVSRATAANYRSEGI